MDTTPILPEQGQFVFLRKRFWQIQDVIVSEHSTGNSHRVLLECLDDDALGFTMNVLWEHELSPIINESDRLPQLVEWDNPAQFKAFMASMSWMAHSALVRDSLIAPYYGAIEIEPYQLEPVVRALSLPRVNLLIADDVGLGKTIEAGLIAQEMLARRTIRKILIVCPASLQRQWQDEMRDKFNLDFQIIDRQSIQTLRREFGVHVNPWTTYPRLITSIDFLKREQPLRLFRESLQQEHAVLRDWDLLIVDEAHNIAPSGRNNYAIDSDRTKMMREIVDHFEHRLFLTATPHNGFTESFSSLLELLDPLRFSRGPYINADQVKRVMIRRLKEDITNALGNRHFAKREVLDLKINLTMAEERLFDLLDTYTQSRLEALDWSHSLPVRFALTMLKKRLLSSPAAFATSLETHLTTLNAPEYAQLGDQQLLEQVTNRVHEDWANDDEKLLAEDDAVTESSRFFTDLTPQERGLLQQLQDAIQHPKLSDTKLHQLIEWIHQHLQLRGQWNGERLVIFTEYKTTLQYLYEQLCDSFDESSLLMLYGGMNMMERERIKASFQSSPSEHPVRILLATDAASEGLNLQNHCRYLIHYEIPWNPNRMEQRNGRIDRHGQKAETVLIHHFTYANRQDSHFLQTVIDKVVTIRTDLGAVGDVIALQVEEAMLGKRTYLSLPEHRQSRAQEMIKADVLTDHAIRDIRRQVDRTREKLQIYPNTLTQVLDSALKLAGTDGLLPPTDPALNGQAYQLPILPRDWEAVSSSVVSVQGYQLNVTFEHKLARDRNDCVLLHLNHPLMRRAVGMYRSRIWSTEEDDLRRVSYRVLDHRALSVPAVIVYGRLVAVGGNSQRLHEEIVMVGGEIEGRNIIPLPLADLERLLQKAYDTPPIPLTVGNDLRRLFNPHERSLRQMLRTLEQERRQELTALAKQRGEEDAVAIRTLIDERIKEIRVRVKQEQQEKPMYQLELFDRDEYLQYQEDMKWLATKITQLEQRRQTEPERIRTGYTMRSVRVFPLALLYLLPETILGG